MQKIWHKVNTQCLWGSQYLYSQPGPLLKVLFLGSWDWLQQGSTKLMSTFEVDIISYIPREHSRQSSGQLEALKLLNSDCEIKFSIQIAEWIKVGHWLPWASFHICSCTTFCFLNSPKDIPGASPSMPGEQKTQLLRIGSSTHSCTLCGTWMGGLYWQVQDLWGMGWRQHHQITIPQMVLSARFFIQREL